MCLPASVTIAAHCHYLSGLSLLLSLSLLADCGCRRCVCVCSGVPVSSGAMLGRSYLVLQFCMTDPLLLDPLPLHSLPPSIISLRWGL